MIKFACFCLVLAAVTPIWSQVEPSAMGGGFDLNDEHMMTPPPVSGNAYPVVVGEEARSNFLTGSLIFTGAYQDNLLLDTSRAVSDETYSFSPLIGYDRRTARQGESFSYTSGFQIYQNTSQLNGVSQNATAGYRFHLSPYAVISFHDSFSQNYNLYNQSNPFGSGGTSANAVLIAPFANQIGNTSGADLQYQYGRNAMFGGGGNFAIQHYAELSDVLGLNNGNSTSGSAFWARRLGRSQYLGVTYQFAKFITHPVSTYTLTNTVFGFYTHYFTRSFSLSVLGGPEHYTAWDAGAPKEGSWGPAIQGSLGWQTRRTNLNVAYSHVVSGAGSMVGTYHTDAGGVNTRFVFARRWSTGAHVEYQSLKNVSTLSAATLFAAGGGHTISGGAYVAHSIGERVQAEAGYQHFHQSYGTIPAASASPDSNREYVSISYGFSRPLGR